MNDFSTVRVVEKPENIPWSVYLGVLGMPGEYCLRSSPRTQRRWGLPPPYQVKRHITVGSSLRKPRRYASDVVLVRKEHG